MRKKKVINEYVTKGKMTELHIKGSIHGDKIILIDTDDIDRIKEHSWTINKFTRCKKIYYYVVTSKGLLLHRYIKGAYEGRKTTVDHINNNTLDNRKINLQICSNRKNLIKQELCINSKTGVKGVCKFTNNNRYMAYITINRKRIHLGYFDTIEEAKVAREEAENTYKYNIAI